MTKVMEYAERDEEGMAELASDGPALGFMSPDEDRLLKYVVSFQRERDSDVGAHALLHAFQDWNSSHLREVCRELIARGMFLPTDIDSTNSYRVKASGHATALMKGYPIVDRHVSTIVSFDRETVIQMTEAFGALHQGQGQVVEACNAIAEELRKPPGSSKAERIQAAMATIQAGAAMAPYFITMVKPMLDLLLNHV